MANKRVKFLKLGFGNIIPMDEVIAVVSTSSSPIKRIIQKAKEEKEQKSISVKEKGLLDLTAGRKARSAIVTDYGRVYLSALQAETILSRTKIGLFDIEDDEA